MSDENLTTDKTGNAAAGWGAAGQGNKVSQETVEQRQNAAEEAAKSAVVPEPENTGEPLGSDEWSDAQKAATGETTGEKVSVAGGHVVAGDVAFYRGPRAENPEDVEERPSLQDLLKAHINDRPLRTGDEEKKGTFSNEQFAAMLAKQSPSESPNARNPTADNDVDVGKTALGETDTSWTPGI